MEGLDLTEEMIEFVGADQNQADQNYEGQNPYKNTFSNN